MPSNLNEFAQRYANAWCSQDPGKVASFFEEDGSLSVNGAVPAVGPAAITEIASVFMISFPDMVVTLDGLLTEADPIRFHWTLEGTNNGPGGTGKRVRISGYEEWQIGAGGLVAESRGHFDVAEYERQLQHGFDGDDAT